MRAAGVTKKERVKRALSHQETDIVPFSVDFTEEEYKKIAEYLNDPYFGEKINNHIDTAYYSGFSEGLSREVKPGHIADDFGVVWNRSGPDKDIGVIENFVMPEPDMKYYPRPLLDFEQMERDYEAVMGRAQDLFKFGSIGFTMFERAWTLRGMENLLTDMVLEPGFVHELMDTICEFNLKIIDLALTFEIDGFHFGDDWGQQKGLIMGPDHWRTFIRPRMAKMFKRVKSKNKFISLHSCGDISEIFGELADIGLDCYQTFQPEIYDIKKVKAEHGGRLSFWGGISTQRMLPFETPDGVREKTAEIMRIMKKGGGYIAAPTHSMPYDIPAENAVAMIEVFENQQKYL